MISPAAGLTIEKELRRRFLELTPALILSHTGPKILINLIP
jgi:hypothetical protein